MYIQTYTGQYEITDILLQAWMIRYPAVDLKREYPLMVLWLAKNPSKKPKNPIRFIENWLSRAQKWAVNDLAEQTKRGAATAERVGALYQVKPQPGESQEAFNRRVIAAASISIVKRVA